MKLDVVTVFLSNCLLFFFVGAVSLFYWKVRKTYPGFGLWVGSIFALTLGNLFVLLRPAMPLVVSVVLTNVFTVLAVMLGLDGSRRFFEDRGLHWSAYVLTLPGIALCAGYLTLAVDRLDLRIIVLSSVATVFLALWARTLFRVKPGPGRVIARTVGATLTAWAVVALARAAEWLVHPDAGVTTPSFLNFFYFMATQVFEVGTAIGFIMLNNSRVEGDLNEAAARLDHTVSELKAANADIKVLTGIIPICSYCKSIRDVDTNDWKRLEEYIRSHSNANFSHGICPACAREHFPDLAED